MTFVHVAFLGGVLAIAVPIVLHLLMRQQPKHLEFPALRFIKRRESTNRRQMRLRHWLLLALRCAVILLLALALARPSIVASGVLGDSEAPVAAALVFDVNPRMQYRQHNQTRLEAAQETAQWLLPQLPNESDVAVVDSRTASAAFAVDRSAARQRVERLDATTATQPLARALEASLELLRESDKARKEVYLFTDLSQATWTSDAMRELGRRMSEWNGIGFYVIDVGATDPTDFGVADLRLSSDVLAGKSPLRATAELAHIGPTAQRAVELYLVDPKSGRADLRAQQQVTLEAGQRPRVDFSLLGLSPGMHRGYVRVAGEDALACDDARWFTAEVRPAWRVLIAAPSDASRAPADYAFFLSQALAPDEFRVQGKAAFDCQVVSTDELAAKTLDDFAAVCLVDPRSVAPAVWQKLRAYVAAGGGLGIFLGRNAVVADFNEAIAQSLMPGKLVRQWRGDTTLAPDVFEHPVLAKFRRLETAWELLPVFRHWQLGDLADGATAVLSYADNQPALVERPVGKGRVMTLTTPISEHASGRDIWNQLPTGDPSVFVMLVNELAYYLVGQGQERLNYVAGETAVVRLASDDRFATCVLTTPGGDHIRSPIDEQLHALVVTSTEAPGNYLVQAGGGATALELGFSVNLPSDVTRLEHASDEEIKAIFGDTPFRLAHNRDEIDRNISAGRVGSELFPYLIVLLAIFLAGEQVLANRFYTDYDTTPPRSRAAEFAAPAAAPRGERPVPISTR